MTEDFGEFGASTKPNKIGPDYFAFYTRELQTLLSLDEDFLPFSTSIAFVPAKRTCADQKDVNDDIPKTFLKGIGGRLSDVKRERLKSLLKQAVVCLSQEVDDMLDPVLALRQIHSELRSKKSLIDRLAAKSDSDVGERPRKKIKMLSSFSSESDAGGEGNKIVTGAQRRFCECTGTTMQRTVPKGSKSLCNLCGHINKQGKFPLSGDDQNSGSFRGSNTETNTESREADNDLQFFLENDTASVEYSIKKCSHELLMTLEYMEQQLEGILDLLQSSSRLMTSDEKHQLQKLIQKLPRRNVDRVVEIIQKNKPLEKDAIETIHVNLEEEDNAILWRLYIYAKAVENAKKLASC